MRVLGSAVLLLAWTLDSVRTGSVTDALDVYYQHEINLGELSGITVEDPTNAFYTMNVMFHAPNGTTRLGIQISDSATHYTTNPQDFGIDLTTNQTCFRRTSAGTGTSSYTGYLRPDSASTAWAYSIVLDQYFSHDYNYVYDKNSTTNEARVCIIAPYITERRQTIVQNLTVRPAENGATTTTYPATATVDLNMVPTPVGTAREKWSLSPAGNGTSYDSYSGAVRSVSTYCSLLVSVFFLTASLLG